MDSVTTSFTIQILNTSGSVLTQKTYSIGKGGNNSEATISIDLTNINQLIYVNCVYSSNTPYNTDCGADMTYGGYIALIGA